MCVRGGCFAAWSCGRTGRLLPRGDVTALMGRLMARCLRLSPLTPCPCLPQGRAEPCPIPEAGARSQGQGWAAWARGLACPGPAGRGSPSPGAGSARGAAWSSLPALPGARGCSWHIGCCTLPLLLAWKAAVSKEPGHAELAPAPNKACHSPASSVPATPSLATRPGNNPAACWPGITAAARPRRGFPPACAGAWGLLQASPQQCPDSKEHPCCCRGPGGHASWVPGACQFWPSLC